jgi:hypothetical protein
MRSHHLGPDDGPAHGVQQEAAADFERELRALLRRHTWPYFVKRVRAFYGDKLDLATAKQVAEHLQSLELACAG